MTDAEKIIDVNSKGIESYLSALETEHLALELELNKSNHPDALQKRQFSFEKKIAQINIGLSTSQTPLQYELYKAIAKQTKSNKRNTLVQWILTSVIIIASLNILILLGYITKVQ